MPRIDPLKLLTCLKVLLASNGGIRSASEVKRLAGLMTKYSKKLVSKCIYIQILKCTETDLLGQFMGLGGWSLTHMWLNDGIRAENWPLVQEILELLLLCPVDVQRLRSNTAPKLVKGLCKDGGTEGVRILAAKLVEQWLKVVKGESMMQVQCSTAPTSIGAVSETISNAQIQDPIGSQESRLPKHIIIESNKIPKAKNSTIPETVTSAEVVIENHSLQDPIDVPEQQISTEINRSEEQQKKTESTLVYRLVVKDGKQVLAKVLNPSKETLRKQKQINENEVETTELVRTSGDEKMDDKFVNKDMEKSEKESDKEVDSKDNKENKEKDKSRGSGKDKEKHRDHKSSSSHHKSSSSKSSTSKSGSSSSSSKSKSSSSSHKSSEKERDKHRSSSVSSSSSSSKHRHEDRNKERSSKDKDRDRKDSKIKDKEKLKIKEKEEDNKEREKVDQAEKDKETLSKIAPTPLDKLGRIPKKPRDENSLSPTSNGPTSITIPSKKASMSIEIRKDSERPKTVKTYNSQFRSHGLTDEAPPPPSRKGLKKPVAHSVPGTSIPSSLPLKRTSPPPSSKDGSSSEKKPKIEMTASSSTEKPGAIKLIAPKPKQSTLVESDMFMDALSASASMKKDSRKRKRRPSATKETSSKDGTTSKDGTSSPPGSPSTPPAEKVAPLKFYQDTLEDNKDEDKALSSEVKDIIKSEEKETDKNEDEDDIPLKRMKEAIEQKVQSEKDEEDEKLKENEDNESDEPPAKKPPGPGCGPNGPPGVLMLHRRKGPKKKLSWKSQEELEEIRYFELDENERVNVTKTFVDMKQMERMNEREAFFLSRKLNCEDIMTEQTTWMPLILVDDVPPHPEGNQSKEKRIQAEREQTTLKALYFNRHMIPDSPAEPDMEQYQITEPAVIPLDDITGNPDAVNDFTSMPWPDPKGSPPQPGENEYMSTNDMAFQANQFNPFMSFTQQQWQMQQGPPGAPGSHPNGVMPGPMIGSMGGFNNMNNMNTMNMNIPPNMIMGPKPDEMPVMNMNMGIMPPPFGASGPNFNGPPNSVPFNNFGPPGNINLNQPSFSPPHRDQNMNRGGGPRGPMAGNNRGNWRAGGGGSVNQLGGNWRPQGPGVGGGGVGGLGGNFGNNWVHGNRGRICKQFQRGHCRNGTKCNYLHTPSNHQRI